MALPTKGHFQINSGTPIAAQKIVPQYDSLASEDSGRTDDGVMHIDWIKTNLRKYEITLPPSPPEVVSSVFSAVQGKTYTLTVFDVQANAEVTVHCYTSNSKADCYSGVLLAGRGVWQNATFSAIEIGD